MGYTRIVQFADTTIIYKYEKPYMKPPERHASRIQKKRAAERRKLSSKIRSKRSIYRSRTRFFRLCNHNNYTAKTVTFCTLTFAYDITIEKANRALSEFFKRIKSKTVTEIPISYISVPEFTQKGRIHYHLLIYNLPATQVENERVTRNYQRQWRRGFVDFRLADTITDGIAGYMAKYMAKAIGNFKSYTGRGYTCSRNVEKPTSAGSNNLDGYVDLIVDLSTHLPTTTAMYNTQYMGHCSMEIYKKIK